MKALSIEDEAWRRPPLSTSCRAHLGYAPVTAFLGPATEALARAICGSGERRDGVSERSRISEHADVAQLVEHWLPKPGVVGSSPIVRFRRRAKIRRPRPRARATQVPQTLAAGQAATDLRSISCEECECRASESLGDDGRTSRGQVESVKLDNRIVDPVASRLVSRVHDDREASCTRGLVGQQTEVHPAR